MRMLVGAVFLGGCAGFTALPPDQFCLEAGYAIAAVTESCTGDRDLANARFEAFQSSVTCIEIDVADPPTGVLPEQLFDCAFAIQDLSCDVVADFGDDISAYLAISPGCALVATASTGGGR